MIWGCGGSKSRLAKAAGAEPAGQMRDENCTPLWREAHFEVKVYKAHHCRTTFGSWDVEKVHAVVARSTFPSENAQNAPGADHFWQLRCRKSARRCSAKHISKSKCTKHTRFGPLLEVEMSKKCTPLWREAHLEVKVEKTEGGLEHFLTFRCRVGHLKRICKDAFSVAAAVQETCSSELLGGPGADFLRGVLRWFCATGAALRMTWHHFFVAGPLLQTGGGEKSQNALVQAVSSTLKFPFLKEVNTELLRFWCCQLQKMRKSRRIASFLTLSSSKLRKSRRIAAFLMLSSSKTEEVSQNSFVFKLADRQIDRETTTTTSLQLQVITNILRYITQH